MKYEIAKTLPNNIEKKLNAYSPILRKLLYSRGIDSEKKAREFLTPDYERDIHNPFLLLNMKKAVRRILKAIDKKETICIYSDYDADGLPGGIILKNFFEKIGYDNFFNYIPHREKEGFGLNIPAIEKITMEGASLIITVDCGMTGVSAVARAKALGIDVIITDHHLENGEPPRAFSIINPKQKGDKYPFKDLCGAALAYKLVQASFMERNFGLPPGWEKWLLDMVAIATVSDMVPLLGENRALVHYGLKVLRKSRRPGLRMILEKAKTDAKNANEDDIGFVIAPRINAASRMDSPELALHAIGSFSLSKSVEAVKRLEHLNNERKGLVAATAKEVKKKISALDELPAIIVSGNPKWRPGILGLVANVIAEEFGRPVFLWGRGAGNVIRGSFRSNQKIDIFSLAKSLPSDLFSNFGGHTFAGGFEIKEEKIHHLKEEIEKAASENDFEISEKEILIDAKLSPSDITADFYADIQKLAPFGMNNPKPTFLLEEALVSEVISFGKEESHTKVIFREEGLRLEAVSFFQKPDSFRSEPQKGVRVNMTAFIEENFFMGRRNLRLRIQEIF